MCQCIHLCPELIGLNGERLALPDAVWIAVNNRDVRPRRQQLCESRRLVSCLELLRRDDADEIRRRFGREFLDPAEETSHDPASQPTD